MNRVNHGHVGNGDVQDKVCAYYEGQSLPPEKLDAILAEFSADMERPTPRRSLHRAVWAVAAGLVLTFLVSGLWVWNSQPPTQLVAREIALNHVKALRPDYPAERFEELASMRDKLGFVPVEPESLGERGLRLAGARYCSVQGCMAAQVSVFDQAGEIWTLYQVRPDERLTKLGEAKIEVDGVEVELWSEAGLVMGLARTR